MIIYFRSINILIVIDGAYAVRGIQLNLTKLDPDFYLSNTHKGLYYHRRASIQASDLIAKMWNSSTLTSNQKFISTINNIQLP
ncbi:unnamed protein product [Rotaria sp. Silwood2]|nr:unnamed protein product [Rotaria sp. Silwood2]CAF3143584.1 unnamed protein product [Rotaria sp. Silwood2]CAF4112492.1 unnamed protein product [Rotaria sp. Silwood2]CAF4359648.1 unnamed protein product [Rotaria sp. Silwood2]CAF4656734.1 unnamed protein product [Rotaria sp. Silwood2]